MKYLSRGSAKRRVAIRCQKISSSATKRHTRRCGRCITTTRKKRIARDAASEEKRNILFNWDKARREAEYVRKMALHYAKLYKDTEMEKTAVRKNPTPENAIKLVRVLDGLENYEPGREEQEE